MNGFCAKNEDLCGKKVGFICETFGADLVKIMSLGSDELCGGANFRQQGLTNNVGVLKVFVVRKYCFVGQTWRISLFRQPENSLTIFRLQRKPPTMFIGRYVVGFETSKKYYRTETG